MKKGKRVKRIIWIVVIIFILMNFVAYFHAYKFTHFSNINITKTKSPDKLSVFGKIKTLLTGVNNPKPVNINVPTQRYETIKLVSNKIIVCWSINTDSAKGTVILFHGYSSNKSSLIDKSNEFINLGYNTFLVDFMGSGESEGNQTTLGFKEAEEVKTAFDYLVQKGETNIYLFGSSMGAVAIMKAINDYEINPKGIIVECPFGSMYQTTCARFNNMGMPSFPMAGLLDFWGGLQNGFWAFNHKPVNYAKNINSPTLLLYGEQDKNVSRKEINDIYANLNCKKTLATYQQAGHEDYLISYKQQWIKDIKTFLETNQ